MPARAFAKDVHLRLWERATRKACEVASKLWRQRGRLYATVTSPFTAQLPALLRAQNDEEEKLLCQ